MSRSNFLLLIAVISLGVADSAIAQSVVRPRLYNGYSDPVSVTVPVAAPAPVPAPRPVIAPVPVVVTPVYAYPAPAYVAPVYLPRPAPVFLPPPVATYGAIGPRGHYRFGYSSPGFGFSFGR